MGNGKEENIKRFISNQANSFFGFFLFQMLQSWTTYSPCTAIQMFTKTQMSSTRIDFSPKRFGHIPSIIINLSLPGIGNASPTNTLSCKWKSSFQQFWGILNFFLHLDTKQSMTWNMKWESHWLFTKEFMWTWRRGNGP